MNYDCASWGLSPLTRGNRHGLLQLPYCAGPIPAHAGQPAGCSAAQSRTGAYPRSRGATVAAYLEHAHESGLSPLTRGNQCVSLASSRSRGPIPAHAGQPRRDYRRLARRRAYPRSRGATLRRGRRQAHRRGLSPLTRGNLSRVLFDQLADGPIPAHAGQPEALDDVGGGAGAYPRSRGATSRASARVSVRPGLSPLTRGNRQGDRRVFAG